MTERGFLVTTREGIDSRFRGNDRKRGGNDREEYGNDIEGEAVLIFTVWASIKGRANSLSVNTCMAILIKPWA